MAFPTYDIGDGIRATAAFKDLNGNPADPTTIVFKLMDPSGLITTPAISRTGAGLYYVDFLVTNLPGEWKFRWEGTGAVQAAEESRFTVKTSAFPL